MCSIITIIGTLALCAPGSGEEGRPSVQMLVDAHASTLGLIHAVDLEIDVYYDGNGSVKVTQPTQTWRWAKQGSLERIRAKRHQVADVTPERVSPDGRPVPEAEKRPMNVDDVFMDGTQMKSLFNWVYNSRDRAQPIDPFDQGTLKATTQPQWRSIPGQASPTRILLLAFQLTPMDGRRSLVELVKESPAAKVVGQAEVGGQKVWQLSVEHAGVLGEYAKSQFDIFLDPSVNYLARKLVVHFPKVLDAKGVPGSVDAVTEVVKFKDCGGGAFVPLEVVQHVKGERYPPEQNCRYYVKNVVVNEALPADALDFRFPKDALVLVLPPKNASRETNVLLWGEDNQPVREFTSAHALREFQKAYMPPELLEAMKQGRGVEEPSIAPHSRRWTFILGVGIPALVVVGWWLVQRRRSRRTG